MAEIKYVNSGFREARGLPGYTSKEVDLVRIDLSARVEVVTRDGEIVYGKNEALLKDIIDWMGVLNSVNSALYWWCFNCVSKNSLASPLIDRLLSMGIAIKLIKENPTKKILITGATIAQRDTIESLFNNKEPNRFNAYVNRHARALFTLTKCLFQAIRVWLVFGRSKNPVLSKRYNFAMLYYLDGTKTSKANAYFGDLEHDLLEVEDQLQIAYIAYVYTPFISRLKTVRKDMRNRHVSLYEFLRIKDYLWSLGKICQKMLSIESYNFPVTYFGTDYSRVLIEVLTEELSKGYLENLLTYRAALNISAINFTERLIYPFENKSLEKCLLIGVRQGGDLRMIGYQHSSVTPRHFSFCFARGECQVTPLPDLIVTLGRITANWMIKQGGFPSERIKVGYALRQNRCVRSVQKRPDRNSIHIMLAVSSSKHELVSGLEFVKKLKSIAPDIEIGIRTHPNFPLSEVSSDASSWVRMNTKNLDKHDLKESFSWADITLYISSTVALESLDFGLPVIKLKIDPLDSDPILGEVPLVWAADSPAQCYDVILEVCNLSDIELTTMRFHAKEYIDDYFVPKHKNSAAVFFEEPRN